MGDSYWRHGAPPAERDSIPRSGFPDYLSSEASLLTTNHQWGSSDFLGSSTDILQRDILPSGHAAYTVNGIAHGRSEHGPGRLSTPPRIRGYGSPLEEPSLLGQRYDVAPGPGVSPRVPGMISDRHSTLRRPDVLPPGERESNILFVDGLPTDCTRREVGHLFRPFIGFKDIKVVHKEPRHIGDKARVLCFVEFADAKCALTALEALQDYRFDDKKPDSPLIRIHFAHFPFQLPPPRDEERRGDIR